MTRRTPSKGKFHQIRTLSKAHQPACVFPLPSGFDRSHCLPVIYTEGLPIPYWTRGSRCRSTRQQDSQGSRARLRERGRIKQDSHHLAFLGHGGTFCSFSGCVLLDAIHSTMMRSQCAGVAGSQPPRHFTPSSVLTASPPGSREHMICPVRMSWAHRPTPQTISP